MEMGNATAGGPSEGLLDILFGSSKSSEASDADGKDFANLLETIRGLGKKVNGTEEDENFHRTDKEMDTGKDAANFGVGGSPVMALMIGLAQANQQNQTKEIDFDNTSEKSNGLQNVRNSAIPLHSYFNSIGGENGGTASAKGANNTIDAKTIDSMLLDRNSAPLAPKELALLQEVNSKLNTKPELNEAESLKLKRAVSSSLKLEEELLAGKGKGATDLAVLKSAEPVVTTDSYLKLRDYASELQANRTDRKLQIVDQGNSEQAKVAMETKGSLEKVEGSESAKPKTAREHLFQSPGGVIPMAMGEPKITNLEFKEVFLAGANASERSPLLMNEISQSVGFQAVKGGGEMRIVIYPEAMGEVHLKVGTRDGKVDVKLTAQNEEVASIIRDGAPDLKLALKDHNLELSKFEVNVSAGDAPLKLDSKIEAKENANQFIFDQRNQSGTHQEGRSQYQGEQRNQDSFYQGDFERSFPGAKTNNNNKQTVSQGRIKQSALDIVA